VKFNSEKLFVQLVKISAPLWNLDMLILKKKKQSDSGHLSATHYFRPDPHAQCLSQWSQYYNQSVLRSDPPLLIFD